MYMVGPIEDMLANAEKLAKQHTRVVLNLYLPSLKLETKHANREVIIASLCMLEEPDDYLPWCHMMQTVFHWTAFWKVCLASY